MPQQNAGVGGAAPIMLLFGLFSSIFMFFFKPVLHFVLNIIARKYTGLSANDIRNMNLSSSVSAIRSAVSNFTERPSSSGQPTYAATVLLQSEICGPIDFQQVKASARNTVVMDDPCSVFVLPLPDARENEMLARLRATLARDAVSLDRQGSAWRVPVDAATALSKANQLGFFTISSCAGNNNVYTWTLACVDKNKPAALPPSRDNSFQQERVSTAGAMRQPNTPNGGSDMITAAGSDTQNNAWQLNSNSSIRRRQGSSTSNNNNNAVPHGGGGGDRAADNARSSNVFAAANPTFDNDDYVRQYPPLGSSP